MEIPEVASKPPLQGLFIQGPPSELVIQTEKHPPPVATMDGRLLQMLEKSKSSQDPNPGIPQ